MSENKLQDLANKLEDRATKEAIAGINEIHSVVMEQDKTIIPEVVFKELFLDFFKDVNNHPNNDGLLLKWLELSGGVYNEVDVINEKGDTLYAVPGICSPGTINESIANNVAFDRIVTTYNNKLNRTQAEGVNYLNGELSKLTNIVEEKNDNTTRWVNIFTRYEDPQAIEDDKNIAQELNKNLGLELDYD